MLKQHLLYLFTLSILLSACTSTNTEDLELKIPEGSKEAVVFEYLIHDVEGVIFNMLFSLHERDQGELYTHAAYNVFSNRGACAHQTLNTNINRLTLDFTQTCTSENGLIRQGQIEINYSDPEDYIGHQMSIVLNNYRVNQIGFNGSISIENTSTTNSADNKTYLISFNDLELIIGSETSLFSGNRAVHYEKDDGAQFETTELTYSAINNLSYTLVNSQTFNLQTPASTLQVFECWLAQQYFPISGRQTISGQNSSIELDFETGGCNNTLHIQAEGEERKTLDLSAIL
ncbi:hypothetical protein [Roseivirga sp.]|uniref:hypothetical protein n=1 Tax=Roseivirga sp. TaxID=1964215 RepID=UPI003B52618E